MRWMNTITLAGVLAAVSVLPAVAQEEEEGGSKLFAGFNMTDGNSETLTLTLGADTRGATDAGEYLADALFTYGESGSETTAENFVAGAQYNQLINEDAYGYLALDFLYDDFAGVDYRLTVGPGLGYYLVNTDANKFAVEAGAAYVTEQVVGSEDVTDPATGAVTSREVELTDDSVALRLAERSDHQVSETARVYQSVEYLPYFEDFDDYILNATVGIDAAINSTLSLTAFVLNRYDSTPAPGLDDNDISVNAGVTYRL